MEYLMIKTNEKTERLMGMLLMDTGRYVAQRNEEGILIHFDESDEASLEDFAVRFSKWLAIEAFKVHGNLHFKGSDLEERWEIWRDDLRFTKVYCDDFYKRFVERSFMNLLFEIEEDYAIEANLNDIVSAYQNVVGTRLELIEDHFKGEIHESYILLRMEHEG